MKGAIGVAGFADHSFISGKLCCQALISCSSTHFSASHHELMAHLIPFSASKAW